MPEPSLDPRVYEANLAALRLSEPQLADLVGGAAPAADAVRPAMTRDGRVSLQVRGDDGLWSWFGRTSIPGARAEALLANFESGHGNVLLPGIAQGCEAKLLLGSLGSHRAVFVWEPDPRQLALALHLYDYAADLAARRLVPIVCPAEALSQTLIDTLEAHPGLLCPERMLMWPWHTYEQTTDMRNAVEVAWHQTETRREQALAAVQPALAGLVGGLRDRPLIAAIHTDPETRCYLAALRQARPHALETVISTATDVHPLARARRLVESGPSPLGLAFLVNTARQDLRGVLPDGLPSVVWLTSTQVSASWTEGVGPRDLVAAPNQAAAARLEAAGLTGCAIVAPPPCMEVVDDRELTEDRPIDVTILCGGTSFDPSLTSLELPTMARVWQAAIELVRAGIDRFSDAQAEEMLRAAEKRLGIGVDDPTLRAQMVHGLGDGFGTDLLRRRIAESLSGRRWKIAFCGPAAPRIEGIQAHDAAGIADYLTVFRQSKVVVHADTTGRMTWPAMLAAGSGAALLCRRHGRDSQAGGTARLFSTGKEILLFGSTAELVKQVGGLLGDPCRRQGLASAGRARCRADHSPTVRIDVIAAAASSYFSSPAQAT